MFATKADNCHCTLHLSNPIFPKFPIRLTPKLAGIIAHFFCDGCISVEKSGYLHIHYYNQNGTLREQFKESISRCFGDIKFHESVNKTTPYIALPAPIGIILLSIIKDFGSKTCRVPNFIKNCRNSNIQSEFIKAFADDESSVRFNPPDRRIEFSVSNKEFLTDMKEMLNKFRIKTSEIHKKVQHGFNFFYFYIRGYENLKRYNEKIGFSHTKKKRILTKLLNSKQRKSYGKGETKELILNLLSRDILTTNDLTILLNRKNITISQHLLTLEKNNEILRKRINGKSFWKIKS